MRSHDAKLISHNSSRRIDELAQGIGMDESERSVVRAAAYFGALDALESAGVIDND